MGSSDQEMPTRESSAYVSESEEWRTNLRGHRLVIELEGFSAWEFVLANFNGSQQSRYDLSTLRVTRHGGLAPSDLALQQALFSLVGAITVVAGHIEAEMKRIILVANEGTKTGFAEVSQTWTDLEKSLQKVAEGEGGLADRLRPVLAWGQEEKIKETRDNVVHSAWLLYDVGHIEASRFAHKSDGHSITATPEEFGGLAERMFEYLTRLQRVVSWPTAVLPPLPEGVPLLKVQMHPVVNAATAE